MTKKVLFVATVLRGHILVFHTPYMQLFRDMGYEVHLCCRNDTEEAHSVIPACDRFIELPFERSPLSKQNLFVYRKLKELIDSEHYDLIHCNTPSGGMLGRLAAKNARKNGTRVVYTAHGFHFFKGAPLKNQIIYYPAEKWLSRFTDLLITINNEDYEQALRFHAGKTALVHGVGVDLSRFENLRPRNEVRAELGLSPNANVMITVGEHTSRKNHETLIRAAALLPNVHVLLCGVGREQELLESLANELKLTDRVHFLGFRNDVPDLLHASDVFVFTSLQEGLPVAQMEAMAAGLPCVVSNVRGNRDLIHQGKGGYLEEPTDAAGFAKDIAVLLEHPEQCREMGLRNQSVIHNYSLDAVMQEMKALYMAEVQPDE